MSHINYNHLYYFWHVYKEGSVVGAAEALYLTPQTITGQIKALVTGKVVQAEGAWTGAQRIRRIGFSLCG